MTRLPFLALCLSSALPGAAQLASIESFPVDHQEPITIRVLNGKDGQPIPNLRMVLLAGYTEGDIAHRFWREEAITNSSGEARLPRPLVNFPFLEASPVRAKLCQAGARGELYKIGRIRSDGWTAPNHCGFLHVADEPGVLTLFARQGEGPGAHAAHPSVDCAFLNTASAAASAPADSASHPPSHANEIESLQEHEPLAHELLDHEPSKQEPSPAAPAPKPSGTAAPVDAYNEMCAPDR